MGRKCLKSSSSWEVSKKGLGSVKREPAHNLPCCRSRDPSTSPPPGHCRHGQLSSKQLPTEAVCMWLTLAAPRSARRHRHTPSPPFPLLLCLPGGACTAPSPNLLLQLGSVGSKNPTPPSHMVIPNEAGRAKTAAASHEVLQALLVPRVLLCCSASRQSSACREKALPRPQMQLCSAPNARSKLLPPGVVQGREAASSLWHWRCSGLGERQKFDFSLLTEEVSSIAQLEEAQAS